MSKPARILIGLYGSKGVGKNFVADIIREYVLSVARIHPIEEGEDPEYRAGQVFLEALAGPIKQFAVNALGLSPEACYGSDKAKMALTDYEWDGMPFDHDKSGKMTVREVLQVVGTELGRDTWGDKMWVNALGSRVKRFFKNANPPWPAVVIVTDVRFDNEVDGVKEMGGLVWRVQGPQRIGKSSKGDVHASERQRDDIKCDATIINDDETSKEDIKKQVAGLLKDVEWFGTVATWIAPFASPPA